MEWLARIQHLDRRIIFLLMGISILIPVLFPLPLAFKVDERVQNLFNTIEALPEGSTVLISADFDPASRPELEPFFRANLDHLFRRNIKVVVVTLWAYAPGLVVPLLQEYATKHNKVDGVDWTFLGFKEGKELVMKEMGVNLRQAFPTNFAGKPVEELPIMNGIKQLKDFPLMVLVSAGFPGTKEWVLQVQTQYNLKMVSSCTAVQTPDYIPYYKSKQLQGLAGGMPGSAQYEMLVGVPTEKALATRGVNVLNMGHAFIIGAILLGNISYFAAKRRGQA